MEVTLTIGGKPVATATEISYSNRPIAFAVGTVADLTGSGSIAVTAREADRLFKFFDRARFTRYWFKRREWYRARENRQMRRAFRDAEREPRSAVVPWVV